MNIEKMTTTLQEAIAEAQQIAVTRKHQEIDIAHLWKIFYNQTILGAIYTLMREWMLIRLKRK